MDATYEPGQVWHMHACDMWLTVLATRKACEGRAKSCTWANRIVVGHDCTPASFLHVQEFYPALTYLAAVLQGHFTVVTRLTEMDA